MAAEKIGARLDFIRLIQLANAFRSGKDYFFDEAKADFWLEQRIRYFS